MSSKTLMPIRVVTSVNTECAENLLIEKPLQAGFSDKNSAVIKKGGYVLLDFGMEICGGIGMVVYTTGKAPDYAKCRVVFGESVMEALSSIGYKNATNSHAVRDLELSVGGKSLLRYGFTGFRFVKIEAVDTDITINVVKAELDIKDIEYKGSFECNDELLNKIWSTGAYTVHLNMHDYVWDGIKRDRLVWIGDLNPEIATIKAVFGYDESVPNSLDFAKSEFPPTSWINTFPSYSMWWIINHYEWYMQNGNLEYLKEQTDYISVLIDEAVLWIKSEQKETAKIFVDWSSRADTDIALIGVYAVMYKAFNIAKEIFLICGKHTEIEKCEKAANLIKQMNLLPPDQKQIAGICGYSGLSDCSRVNREILAVNPLEGLSTFFGYYVLLTRGAAGDINGALEVIRKYWGAMLDMGATTFWEDFDLSWVKGATPIDQIVPEGGIDIHGDFGKFCYKQFRHSLCHGWAGGPTAFLSRYVLGVEILEAGCRRVKINPQIGDLEWVKGSYPTPYGNIEICHKKVNGKIETKVSAPKEITVEVETK